MALTLRRLGVVRGDRVSAYLPNTPEAIVAFLATASLGAIWSICAPDMGVPAIVDRFRQIEPKVLIAADGVHYAGKAMDRSAIVAGLREALPSVESLVTLFPSRARKSMPSSLNGFPSIIRSGFCIPAAPPACPSRSCTAMAASC